MVGIRKKSSLPRARNENVLWRKQVGMKQKQDRMSQTLRSTVRSFVTSKQVVLVMNTLRCVL